MLGQRRISKVAHSMFVVCMLATATVAVVTLGRGVNISSASHHATSNKFSYVAEKDRSVFEQTQNKAEVEAKISQKDTLIQSIDDVRIYGNKQWKLYIDGKLTFENPYTYVTSGGELIEWRLE